MPDNPLHLTPLTRVVFDWFSAQPFVGIWLVLTLLDIMSGWAAAFATKTASSEVSFPGMMKKGIIVILIGVAALVDSATPDLPETKLVAMFFSGHELWSILENAAKAGVPLPPALVDTMSRLRTFKSAQAAQEEQKPLVIEHTREVHYVESPPRGSQGKPAAETVTFDPSLITQTQEGPAIRTADTTPPPSPPQAFPPSEEVAGHQTG